MVLTAVRGAIGFLTRVPIGVDERDWAAFRSTPASMPLIGYPIGLLVALPLGFLSSVPVPIRAFLFPVVIYLLTGLNHVDGLADVGDAAAVHDSSVSVSDDSTDADRMVHQERRRAAMTDTDTGVGGLLAVTLVVLGLAFIGLVLARAPLRTVLGVVVAAEVGAKTAMAWLACFGEASHEGLGSQFTDVASPRSFLPALLLTIPVGVLVWPVAAVSASAAVIVGVLAARWARSRLGGVSGDVFGATNELGRLIALHAGVLVWTLS